MQANDRKLLWGIGLMASVITIGLVVSCTPSRSQPAPPEKPYTVSMPIGQWQKVVDILADKPFKESAPLIGVIQQQIAQQQQPAPAVPPKE